MRLPQLFAIVSLAALFLNSGAAEPKSGNSDLPDGLYAEFNSASGTFITELHYEKTPMTVGSFVGLVEGSIAPRDGKPFSTGLIWYRVVPNFVIQSGDPTNRGAANPPGERSKEQEKAGHPYTLPDEVAPGLHHESAGMLSMANAGPDTNSSEFFVTLRDTHRLNYMHSVFGRVIRGQEVLAKIKQDEPFSIRIVRVGDAAKKFDATEKTLHARIESAKKYSGTPEPTPTSHFDDPDKLLPQDVPRAKNFNFKLANFERFTGRKIYGRVFKEFRPEQDGQTVGAFQRSLAKKLGIERDGVLVSYFADLDSWSIWIAEPLLPTFMGKDGARADFVAGDGLTRRKEQFFSDAKKRGADFAAQSIAEGRTVNDAQRLKLVVDEVLDALIMMYEPKK
jgi:cyclophilin family peptidyl-prolyl cis-trans isomerase